jgi:hypothetical protein
MESLALSMPSELTDDERADLLAIFASEFDSMAQGQNLSGEWVTWILIAKDVGSVAGAANALVVLGKSINAWRKKMKQKGRPSSTHIVGGGGSLLDLSTATDKEVLDWIKALRST